MYLLENIVSGWRKSHTEPIFFSVIWSPENNSLFICYLPAPQQTLGNYQEDSHCYSMLIIINFQIYPNYGDVYSLKRKFGNISEK